jgi:hypothetical protein
MVRLPMERRTASFSLSMLGTSDSSTSVILLGKLRDSLRRSMPRAMRQALRYLTSSEHRSAVLREWHRGRVRRIVAAQASELWAQSGGRVMSGPFAGMRYLEEAFASVWPPKLLGTYEMELAPFIEAAIARRPQCIIDIGAAEGYYAVGLAWRVPEARVRAFEAGEVGRKLLTDLARKNGVADRCDVQGYCTLELLGDVLQDGALTLLICDVEGDEFAILDPLALPGLARADVLVELHPWGHERSTERMRELFQNTHEIEEISSRLRLPADLPPDAQFSASCAEALMDEMRPCEMVWLWLRSRSRSA